jgi:hypothetical protein
VTFHVQGLHFLIFHLDLATISLPVQATKTNTFSSDRNYGNDDVVRQDDLLANLAAQDLH